MGNLHEIHVLAPQDDAARWAAWREYELRCDSYEVARFMEEKIVPLKQIGEGLSAAMHEIHQAFGYVTSFGNARTFSGEVKLDETCYPDEPPHLRVVK